MSRSDVRRGLFNSMKRQFMGPNEEGVLRRVPTQEYLTGILYPEIIKEEKAQDDILTAKERIDAEEEINTNVPQPQSIGLSMILATDELGEKGITIRIAGSIYLEKSKNEWSRSPISEKTPFLEIGEEFLKIKYADSKLTENIPLASIPGSAQDFLSRFNLVWETIPVIEIGRGKIPNRWHLSVFLLNNRKARSGEKASNSLYQVYIAVETVGASAIVARDMVQTRNDADLRSLDLLYHLEHEFAVGHQVSVNWDSRNDSDVYIDKLHIDGKESHTINSMLPKDNLKGDYHERCSMVETTFFPEYRRRSLDFPQTKNLSMYRLSDEMFLEGRPGEREEILASLTRLVDSYEKWIEDQFDESNLKGLTRHEERFHSHKASCERSMQRMREGIQFLNDNPPAYQAFCLMNRAMWLNWINKKQSKAVKGTYIMDTKDKDTAIWRMFQMGFILQNIIGISDPSHEDRELVDLLWVPTGGGKTEAYLGLVTYVLFLSRIKKEAKDQDGIEILMRYTLRLLTLQQFQRAARVILACEYIRLHDRYPILDGCKPFSIGLYVGQGTTPNKTCTGKSHNGIDNDYDLYEDIFKPNNKSNDRPDNQWFKEFEECGSTAEYALRYWEKNRDHELKPTENPVQILNCPWCGHQFTPKDYHVDRRRSLMTLTCGNPKCIFNREKSQLRILTVDDTIMESPPSLLIGTVDKFAQLPFQERTGVLFGLMNGNRIGAPPKLIIQDELHLINGPIGSMVGLYEATIDYLSSTGISLGGEMPESIEDFDPSKEPFKLVGRPKVLASTATIRNAIAQCRQLYDRGAVRFPSPGVSFGDSHFVKERLDDKDDKIYVGVFCAGLGMKSVIKKCVGGLLVDVANEAAAGKHKDDYDPYWTVVSYFNSKRELGGAVTLMRDDVRTNAETVRGTLKNEESIGELHGNLDSTKLPVVLDRLERRAGDLNPPPYDVLLCTNMFSVGIDIDRLGLMVMNCQPKATTEYLQSTGRVGRQGDGLIIVLFNQARPRDQSHFERFYDYHARVQAHVEAMTVTPFSEGSLDRALHAQYVAMLRHTTDIKQLASIRANTECINYSERHRDHPDSKNICLYLIQRAHNVTNVGGSVRQCVEGLTRFQEEWLRRVKAAYDNPTKIKDNKAPRLWYAQRGGRYTRIPTESDAGMSVDAPLNLVPLPFGPY